MGVVVIVLIMTCFVPIPRTVTLQGTLVPERLFTVRASEPGLVAEVFVVAGDTVRPGQPLARLESPSLMEAFRTTDVADPTLLDRLDQLTLTAPPWATSHLDGTTNHTSIFTGGVILSEDVDHLVGQALHAGSPLVDVAALDADRHLPLVVEAHTEERVALRLHPGQRARLSAHLLPADQRHPVEGRVRYVGMAPQAHAGVQGYRVEIDAEGTAIQLSLKAPPFASVEAVVHVGALSVVQDIAAWLRQRPRGTPGA